jgi:hypothetical protein
MFVPILGQRWRHDAVHLLTGQEQTGMGPHDAPPLSRTPLRRGEERDDSSQPMVARIT